MSLIVSLSHSADLCAANFTLTAPNFPLMQSIAEPADRGKEEFDAEANDLLATLGVGFRLRDHGSDFQLRQLLLSACRLTAAIDEFHRNAAGRSPLYILVVQAISFQHRMLCLPPTSTVETEPGQIGLEDEDYIYQITRLTTFIYSDLVIFPTAEARQGRQCLASLLKEQLLLYFQNHRHQLSASSTFDHLLLWSLVLGGIASYNSANREWYAMQVFEHITSRELTWEGLQAILRTFLYWDYVLAPPTEDLWVEAFQSRRTLEESYFGHDAPRRRGL